MFYEILLALFTFLFLIPLALGIVCAIGTISYSLIMVLRKAPSRSRKYV